LTADIWFFLAIGFSFAGYATYLIGLRRELVEPNRASWLIWSAATTLEALTYAAVNPGAPQGWVFAVSAVACILVTLSLLRRSYWAMPTQSESFCIAACLVALIVWLVFRERSAFLDRTGKEALNMQLSYLVYFFVSGLLMFVLIGFVLLPIVGVAWLVLMIIATVKVSSHEEYRYPAIIRFIR